MTPQHAAGALAVVLSAAVIGIMVSGNLGGSDPQSGGFAGLLEDIGVIDALDAVPLVGSIIERDPERGQVLEGQPTRGQATPTAQPAGTPSGVIELGQFGRDSGIGPPDRPTNPVFIDQPTPAPGIIPPPSPSPPPGTCGGFLQPPCPTATPVPTLPPDPTPTVPPPTLPPDPTPTLPPDPTPTLPPDPTPTLPPDPTPTLPPDPTPTPDSDGDGVPDEVDQCPFEPAGSLPDPFRPGCPLIPLP